MHLLNKLSANYVPNVTVTTNGVRRIDYIPRQQDLMDSIIEVSSYGSLALMAGGGLGLLSDHFTSNKESYAGYFFIAGLIWEVSNKVVITINDIRHTRNFYYLVNLASNPNRAQ